LLSKIDKRNNSSDHDESAAIVSYMHQEEDINITSGHVNEGGRNTSTNTSMKKKIRPSSAVINIKSKLPKYNQNDVLSSVKNSLSNKNMELIN